MKRWKGILAIAALGVLLPKGQGMDVAKLEPVEAFYIYMEADKIHLDADTGASGVGYSFDRALEDLHSTADAAVFLDTADYLLVTERTKNILPELQALFRPSARVVVATGAVDMEKALQFLKARDPEYTLKDSMTGDTAIPKLMNALGRYYLE